MYFILLFGVEDQRGIRCMKERETRYNKLLWVGIALSAICILIAGYGFLNEGKEILWRGALIAMLVIWALMGISVWVYGVHDMKRKE